MFALFSTYKKPTNSKKSALVQRARCSINVIFAKKWPCTRDCARSSMKHIFVETRQRRYSRAGARRKITLHIPQRRTIQRNLKHFRGGRSSRSRCKYRDGSCEQRENSSRCERASRLKLDCASNETPRNIPSRDQIRRTFRVIQ